ncbi:hypothetical protein TcCL_Unassigned04847, partial [Trypanosoma cruzi]
PQCSGQVDSHPHSPTHTKGQRHGEEKPAAQCIQEGTRGEGTAIHIVPQNSNANSTHPQPQQEERGASKSTALSFTYLCPEGIALRLTAGRGGGAPHSQ